MEEDHVWKDLESVQSAFAERLLKQYKKQVFWTRFGFRVLGALLVTASVCSPLLLLIPEDRRMPYLAAATFSIALLAGLNAFFQWQALWQRACGMEILIEQTIALWRVQLAEARMKANKDAAVAATRSLVDTIGNARSAETVRFFGRIQLPDDARAGGQVERTVPS